LLAITVGMAGKTELSRGKQEAGVFSCTEEMLGSQ